MLGTVSLLDEAVLPRKKGLEIHFVARIESERLVKKVGCFPLAIVFPLLNVSDYNIYC